jgi:hypothetical protein
MLLTADAHVAGHSATELIQRIVRTLPIPGPVSGTTNQIGAR